jgi:4-hydroxybenzoate polyprenyltransferase
MGVLTTGSAVDIECERAQAAAVPLVVDLDDTLLRTDSLLEAMFLFLRRHPLRAFELSLPLLKGRAVIKRFLAERAPPDVAHLPYREDLVSYLRVQKESGRHLVLATGADASIAARVADQLGIFDEVLASDGKNNLTGEHKRARLVARFGEQGFDYIGDGRREDTVWRSARNARLAARPVGPSTYLRAMRPHHWLKNLLIFVPLFTAHLLGDRERLIAALIGFVAFSLCASSIYLLNDLLDLPYDRAHPQKKERPLASGQIRLANAMMLALGLVTGAALLSLTLPPGFGIVLAVYFTLMIAYSVRLKDIPIVDALVLAFGYASRVIAGAIIAGVSPSLWLLAFCVALFTSLALTKRYTELLTMERIASPRRAHARGYLPQDRTLIAAQGIASGYLAALLLPLYTLTAGASNNTPFWLLSLLLFYWINYMWLVAHRGRMHHDPLAFALSDRTSQVILLLAAIAGFFAA